MSHYYHHHYHHCRDDDYNNYNHTDVSYLSRCIIIVFRVIIQLIELPSSSSSSIIISKWIYIITIIIGVIPLLYSSYITIIIRSQIDIHVLMLLAISGATLNQDYFDGSLIITLFLLAELMETIIMFRVRKAVQLSVSIGIIPSYTYLIDGNKIAIYDIKIDDILSVRAGEMILADGRVIKGECIVDESALTGESIPIQKNINDIVKSGSIVQNGYIELRVSVASKDSTLQR